MDSPAADVAAAAAALRALLPAGAGVGARAPGTAPPPWPGESPGRATPCRLAEFAAGRAAARAALADAGLLPAAIPMRADRSPAFPAGVAGSIAHTAALALAAVLPGGGAIGIDLEPDEPLPDDIAAEILTPAEARHLRPAARAVFVAKEAAFKAQFARNGGIFGFETLEITLAPPLFTARFTRAVPPFVQGDALQGRLTRAAGHLIAAVALPAA